MSVFSDEFMFHLFAEECSLSRSQNAAIEHRREQESSRWRYRYE
ncbi:hypothetical protein [uncultured Methanolobus sp.]|nr:hypothetical protein [uncultured Methanolobus sp.]